MKPHLQGGATSICRIIENMADLSFHLPILSLNMRPSPVLSGGG